MAGTMIERVATALKAEIGRQWDAKPLPGPIDGSDDWSATGGTIGLAEMARAAIEAMREPTEGMLDGTAPLAEAQIITIWRAMIDAALEERTEGRAAHPRAATT